MTITYTGKVANARVGSFTRLLFYWRGSIYKLMYKEMFIFCGLYTTISLVYRLALPPNYKRVFEQISLYCQTFTDLIPMSFILGFYVSIVVTRWWNQYLRIPWPDRIMMYLSAGVDGADSYARLVRRTIVRYLTLGSLMVFQSTAVSVKKRFPTMEHLIEAGVVSVREAKQLDEINSPHGKWWIPFLWITNLLKQAKKDGRVSDNFIFKCLIDEVMTYRGSLGELYSYDWISVPLVYTQVTTLAVYIFFVGALVGRQFLDPLQGYAGHTVDLYVPFFTLLQFFFYMGWLKVAEQLINPFGEDDDDFEMNWIIDRNLQISLLAVDDLYDSYPPLEKDMYYDDPPPEYLPYTKSSINTKIDPHIGSMADLTVSSDGMRTVNPLQMIREEAGRLATRPSALPSLRSSRSHQCSPCVSPTKRRLYQQNLLDTLTRSQNSKLNIDSPATGRFHVRPVEEPLASKAQSYIDQWLHKADGGHGMVDSRRPDEHDTDSLIFTIDMEETEAPNISISLPVNPLKPGDVEQGTDIKTTMVAEDAGPLAEDCLLTNESAAMITVNSMTPLLNEQKPEC